jgi:hypothetical protein
MPANLCFRQKDTVPIDASAKQYHIQFSNKNVEFNYYFGNGLVWDFYVMFARCPILTEKDSCQNQYIRRIHHKIKKGLLVA